MDSKEKESDEFRLITGYIKNNIIENTKLDPSHPTSIVIIILQYLGNIFFKFDINTGNFQCIEVIKRKIIDRPVYCFEYEPTDYRLMAAKTPTIIFFGSSKGVKDNQIKNFQIKISKQSADSIGVVNDLSLFSKDTFLYTRVGHHGYQIYHENKTKFHENIISYYLEKGGKDVSFFDTNDKKQKYLRNVSNTTWNENSIISVTVDCKKWIIKFEIDDILIGQIIKIEKTTEYYFVIESKSNNIKYQIV